MPPGTIRSEAVRHRCGWLLSVIPLVPAAALVFLALRATPRRDDDTGFYPDDTIRQLAPHDIAATTRAARWIYDVPCLEIDLEGHPMPRRDVFRKLGLDDERIGPPQLLCGFTGHAGFVRWQVSPSYALVYMTARGEGNEGMAEWAAPDRPVYGVRLVSVPDTPNCVWW